MAVGNQPRMEMAEIEEDLNNNNNNNLLEQIGMQEVAQHIQNVDQAMEIEDDRLANPGDAGRPVEHRFGWNNNNDFDDWEIDEPDLEVMINTIRQWNRLKLKRAHDELDDPCDRPLKVRIKDSDVSKYHPDGPHCKKESD